MGSGRGSPYSERQVSMIFLASHHGRLSSLCTQLPELLDTLPNAQNPCNSRPVAPKTLPSEVTADLRLNEPRASPRTGLRQVTLLQKLWFITGHSWKRSAIMTS